jgi:uncharacterized protein with HEPN domain
MQKDPAIYVRHILEAIANIETDMAGYDFERFRVDRRTRQLVERNLEILRPLKDAVARIAAAIAGTK